MFNFTKKILVKIEEKKIENETVKKSFVRTNAHVRGCVCKNDVSEVQCFGPYIIVLILAYIDTL